MHLVDGKAAQAVAIAVDAVEVADFRPPARHALFGAGGCEDDVAAGQIDGFVIGAAEARRDLAGGGIGELVFVEMVVVEAVGFFPSESDAGTVERDIGIAHHAVRVFDEGAGCAVGGAFGKFEPREPRAGLEKPFGARIGQAFGVADEGHPERVAFGENP